MWFKNIQLFRFNSDKLPSQDDLTQALEKRLFSPCSKLQPQSMGFYAPLPEAEELVHKDQDYLLIAIKRQERLLPASVIKEFLDDKVQEIQQEQDRKVGRKEKADLKEQLIFELLPQAFTRSSLMHLVIDHEQKLLLIASPSQARAEEAMKLLRDCLGTLDISPLASCQDISGFLQQSFLGQHSPNFHPLPEFELKQPGEEEATLKHRNHGLTDDEIKSHLSQGWQVSKLSLEFRDMLSVNLDQLGHLKRLRYLDTGEDTQDRVDDHPAARAAHEFAIWVRIISKFNSDLLAQTKTLDAL